MGGDRREKSPKGTLGQHLLTQPHVPTSVPFPQMSLGCSLGIPTVPLQCSQPQLSLLTDDLGIGLHQVVRDVPACQVLKDVPCASLHLWDGQMGCMDTQPCGIPGASPAPTASSDGVLGLLLLGWGLPGVVGAPQPPQDTQAASSVPPAHCTDTGGMAQPVSSSHAAVLPAWMGRLRGPRSRRGGKLVGTALSWAPGERKRILLPAWCELGVPATTTGVLGVPQRHSRWQSCSVGSWALRCPLQPPSRGHSRLPLFLHALGAEAGLSQERVQQPGCVGISRSIITAGRHRSELVAVKDEGHGGHRAGDTPEKGELLPVHPGLELQGRVLPEGRHDEAEEQRDADEDGGEDDLRRSGGMIRVGSAPPCPVSCPIPSPRPHLRQEAAGAAPGVEHPLGEESAELAAGERPAPHPAAGLPRRPPQQIRLPGLLRCQDREGVARGRCQAGCGGQGIPPPQQGRDAACRSPQSLPKQPPAPTSPGSFGSM